jgi:hypothetical protein
LLLPFPLHGRGVGPCLLGGRVEFGCAPRLGADLVGDVGFDLQQRELLDLALHGLGLRSLGLHGVGEGALGLGAAIGSRVCAASFCCSRSVFCCSSSTSSSSTPFSRRSSTWRGSWTRSALGASSACASSRARPTSVSTGSRV